MNRSPARTRYLLLDGLRGMAALAIVIHHFTASSGQREVFASASIAVDFFFCLGGFVIAHAYQQRLLAGMSVWEYTRRRVTRLYPMFLVGWGLGLAALALGKVHGVNDMSWGDVNAAAVLNVLYIPFLNADHVQIFEQRLIGMAFPLNGPAWSLFFALIANVFYAWMIRSRRNWAALIALVSAGALVLSAMGFGEAAGWSTANIVGGLPRVTFAFFAGVGLYQLRPLVERLPAMHGAVVAGVALGMLAIPRFSGHIYYWLACAVFVVPVLVAIAAVPARVTAPWAERLCEYSGSLSYTIFCIHYPLLMLFAIVFPYSAGIALLVAYVATALALAHVLHRYVERPMRRWLGTNLEMAKT